MCLLNHLPTIPSWVKDRVVETSQEKVTFFCLLRSHPARIHFLNQRVPKAGGGESLNEIE